MIDRIADKECKMGFGKPLKKPKCNSDMNSDHRSRKSREYTNSSRVLIGIPASPGVNTKKITKIIKIMIIIMVN